MGRAERACTCARSNGGESGQAWRSPGGTWGRRQTHADGGESQKLTHHRSAFEIFSITRSHSAHSEAREPRVERAEYPDGFVPAGIRRQRELSIHLNENTVYRFTSTIWYGARSRGVYPVADWGLAGCAGCACRGGRARVPGVACGARYSGAGVGRGVSGDSKRMRIRVEPFSHRRASGSGGQPQAHRVHQTRGAAGRSCFCGSPCGSFSSRPPLVPALIVGRQPLGHT